MAGSIPTTGTSGRSARSFRTATLVAVLHATTTAFVAAAAGVPVAKHGNRAASSQCGTADCLEALGVNIDQSPAKCVELLKTAGMCFFFAQKYHTSMKYVGAIRKELGFRTVFNILGPLANPAGVKRCALGVYAPEIIAIYIDTLRRLAMHHCLVFCGPDGLDELGLAGENLVEELFADGTSRPCNIDPKAIFV